MIFHEHDEDEDLREIEVVFAKLSLTKIYDLFYFNVWNETHLFKCMRECTQKSKNELNESVMQIYE